MKDYLISKPTSSNWDNSFLKIYIENKEGKGKTVLCYNDNSTLILSEIIGITPHTTPVVKSHNVEWESSYGKISTDGAVMRKM